MTHREILEALSGLLMALFVGLLSSTIVANALPRITSDLHGTETQYTWVVTAMLLAATAATPIWGKLADLFSKKLLMQLAIVVFIAGSALCGLSTSMGMLIGFRIIQGIGMGGLQALAQTVMGAMIAPRERGRYSGYLGAVMAVATVGGPLLGGVIVDTSWLGWRWCFYVGVPIAAVALVVLQKTLHLPTHKRHVRIDWLGATLLVLGVSLLLVWVSFAGTQFDWRSWQTAAMVSGGVASLLLAIVVESRVPEPIIPLPILRDRTTALAIVASVAVGMAMFGASVFLGQYFQIARGWSATKAGLATIPMIAGLLVASTVSGNLISRHGRWKGFLVAGSVLLVAGLLLLGTVDHATGYGRLAAYMALIGLGLGMTMQNLVLAVQNTVDLRDIGVASSVVTFFRSMGGAMGVSVLGAVVSHQVGSQLADRLRALGVQAGADNGQNSLDLGALPPALRSLVREVYGDVIGNAFTIAGVIAIVTALAVVFIREVPLRQSHAAQHTAEPAPEQLGGPAITGNIRTTAERPVAGASVTLAYPHGGQVDRTRSAADGSYRVHPPAPGTYLLISSAPDTAPQASLVTVHDGSVHHDLELAPSGVLGGHVRAARRPVFAARVTVTGPDGEVAGTATTTTDGSYEIGGLEPGTYTVTVRAPGHQPAACTVTVDGRGYQEVELPTAARVAGTIRADSDGRPLPEATVTLLDEAGTVRASQRTNRDGAYAFEGLPEGQYTVIAAGYAPVAAGVRLAAGDDVAHHVVLS
jgi:EmrB/QacA subfamily drug resistance transporter